MQKQKFLECPKTPRNIFLENIKNTGRRIHARGASTCPRGWGRACPPGRTPCLVGPLTLHRPQLQLHIFVFGEKKNQREGFIAFYDMEPPPSPNLSGGLIWSPFGAPERGIRRHRCRCQNRQISGRGSQTVRLRRMVTGGRGHNVLPRFGPS